MLNPIAEPTGNIGLELRQDIESIIQNKQSIDISSQIDVQTNLHSDYRTFFAVISYALGSNHWKIKRKNGPVIYLEIS